MKESFLTTAAHPSPRARVICLMLGLLAIQCGAFAQGYDDLVRPIDGHARRASSADPDWDHGWMDYRSIAPGGTLQIANLLGPGQIQHIWFTVGLASGDLPDGWPRGLELCFYWDDATTSAVQAPLGDFFAVGNGKAAAIESAMVQVGGSDLRAYNCYWPMPFAGRARLEVRNNLGITIDKFYYHVDWIEKDTLDPAAPYFHAQYHQAYPLPVGQDYVVADIQGRGHYVGTVFSLVDVPGVSFGEGDERFFIDGETAPSILGTGSEDYIGDAWGFHNHSSLYHGYRSLSDGMTMYRWHVLDPIPFDRSLKLTWENAGYGPSGYGEQTFKFSSVAFWYQLDQPQPSSGAQKAWLRMH